jgi:hypothetical protein
MRNAIFAAAAALALVVGTAPSFADPTQGSNNSSSIEDQCANILAKGTGSAAERELCENKY